MTDLDNTVSETLTDYMVELTFDEEPKLVLPAGIWNILISYRSYKSLIYYNATMKEKIKQILSLTFRTCINYTNEGVANIWTYYLILVFLSFTGPGWIPSTY